MHGPALVRRRGACSSPRSGGIPPLLVMAAVAGALQDAVWVFLPTVFVGRALRFWLVLVGVEFLHSTDALPVGCGPCR